MSRQELGRNHHLWIRMMNSAGDVLRLTRHERKERAREGEQVLRFICVVGLDDPERASTSARECRHVVDGFGKLLEKR